MRSLSSMISVALALIAGKARPVAGALLALAVAAMALPHQGLAQFDDASGVWSMVVTDRFGQRQRCQLELSNSSSILGGYRANISGCGGAFMSVSQWKMNRRGLTLNDMSGRSLITLRRSYGGFSGRSSSGQSVWLRGGQSMSSFDGAFGPSVAPPIMQAPRGCSIYYGLSQRCAAEDDVYAPRLAPGQALSVRLVSPANLRQAPGLNAPSLGTMPLNACVVADACGRQADGAEWCRVRYGDQIGYVVKVFARGGRRYTLFSNACSPP